MLFGDAKATCDGMYTPLPQPGSFCILPFECLLELD